MGLPKAYSEDGKGIKQIETKYIGYFFPSLCKCRSLNTKKLECWL